jgi:hypothetical protein
MRQISPILLCLPWVLGARAAAGITALLVHPARAWLRTAYVQLPTQAA